MLRHDVTWSSFSVRIGWAPAAVVVFHSAYGWLIGHPPALDLVMHPLGGLAIAYAAHEAIPRLQPLFGRLTRVAHHSLVLGASFVCANLWEYAEFLADILVDSKIQTSVEETMIDLVLGTGAAAVFVVASWVGSDGVATDSVQLRDESDTLSASSFQAGPAHNQGASEMKVKTNTRSGYTKSLYE